MVLFQTWESFVDYLEKEFKCHRRYVAILLANKLIKRGAACEIHGNGVLYTQDIPVKK